MLQKLNDQNFEHKNLRHKFYNKTGGRSGNSMYLAAPPIKR